MTTSTRGRAGALARSGFVVALMAGNPAVAQVTQTDAVKTPLPQPVGASELSIVNTSWAWNADTPIIRDLSGQELLPVGRYGDIYAPPTYPQFVTGDAIELRGLFKWRKEVIDPATDATTAPGYISGKCGFNAELLLVGGNCQARFGWYNVADPASKTPPLPAEIYPLIAVPHEALHCVEGDGKTPKADGFCPLAWDNRGPYDLSVLRWTPTVFSSGDLSHDPRYKGGDVAFALIGDPQKCPQNKYSMFEHNQRNSSGTPWVTSLLYRSKVDPNGLYIAFEDLPMSAADWKKTGSGGTTAGADGDFNDYVVYVSRIACPGEVDTACVGKNCPAGQTCQLGACVDPCASVVCPENSLCVNGTCSSSSGTGGSSGAASGGTSSIETAAAGEGGAADAGEGGTEARPAGGAAGEEGGAVSTAGADAQGGTTNAAMPPNNQTQKSSSCSYAPLTSSPTSPAWSVMGLAIGLTLLRRRQASSSARR